MWVRLKTDRDCRRATAYFHYGPGGGAVTDRDLFASLADIGSQVPWSAGTLRPDFGESGAACKLMFARPSDAR